MSNTVTRNFSHLDNTMPRLLPTITGGSEGVRDPIPFMQFSP